MNNYYDIQTVKEALCGPVPSVNPLFNKDGSIDWKATANLIDYQIQHGAKAILVTQGDSLLSVLSDDETAELNKITAETVNKRAMVIGCGKIWNHAQNIQFAEYGKSIGCDLMIPVLPDWAQSVDIKLAADCFHELGKIMPLMILTNMMNGRGMPVAVYDLLEKGCGVVAVKDDTPMPYARDMGRFVRNKFAYLSGGLKTLFLQHEPYGADGYLSVFGRIFPSVSNAFWKCHSEGNREKAMEIIEKYEMPLINFWQSGGKNFDATIHGMYEAAGLGKRWRRTPYSSLTDSQMEDVREFLEKLNLI